jgi:hypothetical protein
MDTYKKFSIGDIVTVKAITEHQYYNYPKGRNLTTLNPGDKAVIVSIPPKVRISKIGTGEYFFNLVKIKDNDFPDLNNYFPVFDYHNLVKLA